MRKISKIWISIWASAMLLGIGLTGFAGNEDRVGQAGATELLINPWARSSGLGSANSASVTGLEALYLNVAGTAFTKKTEIMFAHTRWLEGSGISINSLGLTQKVGEAGVIGIGIMSMGFGEIDVTTVDEPEGTGTTFSPQYLNIGVSYAKVFSNSIHGGIALKVISESISNMNAMGVAFDAGIQYVTSIGARDKERNEDNLKFGISLRNVGPPMSFSGDGLSLRGVIPTTGSNITLEQRSAEFELPSLLNIGATYIYKVVPNHHISFNGTFTSNSFSKDQYRAGIEYGFKEYFSIRGGYVYEKDVLDDALRTTAYTGPAGGISVGAPLGEGGASFSIDYSYRATNPFQGTHSFGARINL